MSSCQLAEVNEPCATTPEGVESKRGDTTVKTKKGENLSKHTVGDMGGLTN